MTWAPCIYWPGYGAMVEGGCPDCPAEIEEDFGDCEENDLDEDDEYPGEDIKRMDPN